MKQLTDLEICKCIAEIEDIYYMETKYTDRDNFLGLVSAPDGSGTPPELIGEYNPLTDDALCFQLMVKYDIDFISPYRPHGDIKYEAEMFINNYSNTVNAYDENPNKAICLAIIEANKS